MQPQTQQNQRDGSFWIGIFLGALLGAVLIVLMGTERGKKLAKQLQDKSLDLFDDVSDTMVDRAADVVETITQKVATLEQTGAELIEQGKNLIDEGRVLEETAVEKVIEKKDELIERAQQATQNVVGDRVSQAVGAADAALEHIEKLQERGRNTTAEIRKMFKNIPKKA